MSFLSQLKKEGSGIIWLIEVSNTNFASVQHRWATHACHLGALTFDPRIVKIGKISKAFGLDGFPTVTTFQLALDNTKFDMDWLVDVAGGPIEFTYRFRLTLGLFDPNALNPLIDVEPDTMVMGTFGMLDSPARTNSTVELSLADDSMGRLNELATSPTINEWIADAGTTVDNNLLFGATNQQLPNISWDTPLPIVFGPNATGVLASAGEWSANGGFLDSLGYTHSIVVCVTTSSDAVTANDVEQLDVTYNPATLFAGVPWQGAGATISLPQTVTIGTGDPLGRTAGTYNIWVAQKSQAITKDGHSWKILWIAFSAQAYLNWCINTPGLGMVIGGGDTGNGNVAPQGELYPYLPDAYGVANGFISAIAAISSFRVRGFPFSALTEKTSQYVTGVSVIEDLVSGYSRGSSGDVDTAAFALAVQQNPTWVAGVLQPLQAPSYKPAQYLTPVAAAIQPGALRQVIGEIAQSIGVDVFFTWAGLFSISASWFDFATITATHLAVEETRMFNIRERKPSQGERWTYYNRLYLQGPDGSLYGPYDNQQAINTVGVIVPRTIIGKWLLPDTSGGNPASVDGLWQLVPRLEAVQRNLMTFTTDREALQLDLGSLFTLSWTRGNTQAVYTAAAFQVQSIGVDPGTLAVDIECVWVNDVATVNPYLLDDESLVLVVASAVGRNATVTDGSDIVAFSSGDLTADGINDGDILVLTDILQSAPSNVFSRYRAFRIEPVDSTHVQIDHPTDLMFDAPSGVAVTSWAIYRGVRSYPDAGSDPTHYPNGSLMYGKVASSSGIFSNSDSGNQLLDG